MRQPPSSRLYPFLALRGKGEGGLVVFPDSSGIGQGLGRWWEDVRGGGGLDLHLAWPIS